MKTYIVMKKPNASQILDLLNGKDGSKYISELYHSLLEYIKSGKAIYDMGRFY
ncbi:hypothetical protein IH879_12160 [candidate division KSB1 bacterium]|nr:hypothetical protein [candidate division KSB1 bacterium]